MRSELIFKVYTLIMHKINNENNLIKSLAPPLKFILLFVYLITLIQ